MWEKYISILGGGTEDKDKDQDKGNDNDDNGGDDKKNKYKKDKKGGLLQIAILIRIWCS